jgi:hypothetical protein
VSAANGAKSSLHLGFSCEEEEQNEKESGARCAFMAFFRADHSSRMRKVKR